MSILSMVAHVSPQDAAFAQTQLTTIKGVDILNSSLASETSDAPLEGGKILFLLDLEDEDEFAASLKQIQELKELKSLSYAAHYSEEAINENKQI